METDCGVHQDTIFWLRYFFFSLCPIIFPNGKRSALFCFRTRFCHLLCVSKLSIYFLSREMGKKGQIGFGDNSTSSSDPSSVCLTVHTLVTGMVVWQECAWLNRTHDQAERPPSRLLLEARKSASCSAAERKGTLAVRNRRPNVGGCD